MTDFDSLSDHEFRWFAKQYIEELMGRLDAMSERVDDLETQLNEVNEGIDDLWGAITDAD